MSGGRLHCDGRSGVVVVGPGTIGYRFHVGTTMPDPHSLSFPFGFATEGENVFGMLIYFTLLRHFPEGGIIMGSVFTDDSDLLGAFNYTVANLV